MLKSHKQEGIDYNWYCDHCGELVEFNNMVTVEVRVHGKMNSKRSEFHSNCAKLVTIKEILEGMK